MKGEERRELIERAIQTGHHYKQENTGLIHYPTPDLIPLYLNFCFCLALLRSLVGDNVQEAKERLLHLLSFQKEGLFPIYLHEYPKVSPYSQCSYPLKLIEKHFGSILGDEIRELLKTVAPMPSPPHEILTSRDAALKALHLEDLTPLTSYWDSEHQIYAGPLNDERQNQGEIELTLFDLMMGSPPRIVDPHPVHIEGALIFTSRPTHFLTQLHAAPTPHGKGYHLLRKVWKGENQLHTLVCQEKRIALEGDRLTYPDEIPDEKHRTELSFYVNYHPDNSIRVNGEKGTVFKLGDRVQIGDKWVLSMDLVDGKGDFLGHISRGNRPAQLDADITQAHDWKISLRTLRRTPNLKLKLALLEA